MTGSRFTKGQLYVGLGILIGVIFALEGRLEASGGVGMLLGHSR
jgi:hypothetical protein